MVRSDVDIEARDAGRESAEVPVARAPSGGGRRQGVEGEDDRTFLRAGLDRGRAGITRRRLRAQLRRGGRHCPDSTPRSVPCRRKAYRLGEWSPPDVSSSRDAVDGRFLDRLRPQGRLQQAIAEGIVLAALWGVFSGVLLQNGLAWGIATGVAVGVVGGVLKFALPSGIPWVQKRPLAVAVLVLLPVVVLVLFIVWTS